MPGLGLPPILVDEGCRRHGSRCSRSGVGMVHGETMQPQAGNHAVGDEAVVFDEKKVQKRIP